MTDAARAPTDAQLSDLYDYFAGIAVENYKRHGAVGPSLFAVRLGGATLLESVVEMEDLMRALQESDVMRAGVRPRCPRRMPRYLHMQPLQVHCIG